MPQNSEVTERTSDKESLNDPQDIRHGLNLLIPVLIASDSLDPTMSLRSRPASYEHFSVSFPHERVVQVTLTRTDKLNSINKATSREIQEVWELFDQDESLWVGIITGTGRAFCTGADLHGLF